MRHTYNSFVKLTIINSLLPSSVGRYQYFASGIQYYKFKTVFGISWYFGLVQIYKLHHFCYIKLTLTSKISTQSPCNNTDDYMAGENRCHFAVYL